MAFDEYTFDLAPFLPHDEAVHYKASDRYLHELFFPDLQQDWERRNRDKLLTEGTARLATPFYNIAAVAMALAAILGGGFSRLGYGRRIAITAASAAGVRILGFVVQAACDNDAWLNVLQFVVPLGATAVSLRMIFRKRVPRAADQRRVRFRSLERAAA